MSKRPAPADEPELAFAPGQQVTFTVLSDAGADGSYRVRLVSGEVFDLTPRQWRQEHAPDAEPAMATSSMANLGGHLPPRKVFTPGQRVIIIAPVLSPHLGKQGSIQGPIAGKGDGYHVRLDCGSVFAFSTQNLNLQDLNLQDAGASSSSSSTAQNLQDTGASAQFRLQLLERKVVAMEAQNLTFWEMHWRAMERMDKFEEKLTKRRH